MIPPGVIHLVRTSLTCARGSGCGVFIYPEQFARGTKVWLRSERPSLSFSLFSFYISLCFFLIWKAQVPNQEPYTYVRIMPTPLAGNMRTRTAAHELRMPNSGWKRPAGLALYLPGRARPRKLDTRLRIRPSVVRVLWPVLFCCGRVLFALRALV